MKTHFVETEDRLTGEGDLDLLKIEEEEEEDEEDLCRLPSGDLGLGLEISSSLEPNWILQELRYQLRCVKR